MGNVLGNNHIETASSLNNIASIYAKLQRYPAALDFYNNSISIVRDRDGCQRELSVFLFKDVSMEVIK